MGKVKLLAACVAALAAFMISSCESDDPITDPDTPPVVTPEEPDDTPVAWLPKSTLEIGAAVADSIVFDSEDWSLISVEFDDGVNMDAGLSGKHPFSAQYEWLMLDYADRQLTVSASEEIAHRFVTEGAVEHRSVKLLISHSGVTDTLTCTQQSDLLIGVGLSKRRAFLDFSRVDCRDEVTFDTSDWTLKSVLFDRGKVKHVVEQSGSEPFDTQCDWLIISYADRRMVLTASKDHEHWFEPVDGELAYRRAKLVFERVGVGDTLVCIEQSDIPLRNPIVKFTPSEIVFLAEGGSCSVTTDDKTWLIRYVEVDGKRQDYDEKEGNDGENLDYLIPAPYYATTVDWLTVERGKNGDVKELTLTVEPNTSDQERVFEIFVADIMSRGFINGRQAAAK